MNEKGNRTISLIAAFAAGVVVAAIIAFALTRQQSSTAQQAGQTEQEAVAAQQAEQGADDAQQAEQTEQGTDAARESCECP